MSKRSQTYLMLACLLIMVALLLFSIVFPLLQEVKLNSQELRHQKKMLAALQQQLDGLASLKKDYLALGQDLARIEELFVDKEAPIDFIEFLERQAQGLDLALEILPLRLQASQDDFWQPLGFQILVAGSFPSCLKFLEKLEASPFLLRFESIDINRFSKREIQYSKIEGLVPGDVSLILNLRVFAKNKE